LAEGGKRNGHVASEMNQSDGDDADVRHAVPLRNGNQDNGQFDLMINIFNNKNLTLCWLDTAWKG